MPVSTRKKTAEMEGTLKDLMEMMKEMRSGQEEMKKEMTRGREEIKEEMTSMTKEMEKGQNAMEIMREEIQKDMKQHFEEHKDNFDRQINDVISKVTTEMDKKLESIEEVVEEKVEHVKREIGKEIVDLRQDVDQEITDIREAVNKIVSQHGLLQKGANGRTEECHVSSTKIKPPTYDGKTSWQTYMKQFDAAATANNWNDSERATALIVSLRGEALEVLQTLSEDKHKNYEDLVLHLEMRFGDKHLQQVYQAQLKGRMQRSSETLQQYEADIARLVYLAYPTAPPDFIEQLAVQVFIDGVRDCETQQALRLARCKKLNEVLAYALEFEAAKQASRGHSSRVRQVRIRSPNWRSRRNDEGPQNWKEAIENVLDELATLKNEMKQGRQSMTWVNRRNIRCWNCGEEGHIRPKCPKPIREESPARRNEMNQENSN